MQEDKHQCDKPYSCRKRMNSITLLKGSKNHERPRLKTGTCDFEIPGDESLKYKRTWKEKPFSWDFFVNRTVNVTLIQQVKDKFLNFFIQSQFQLGTEKLELYHKFVNLVVMKILVMTVRNGSQKRCKNRKVKKIVSEMEPKRK